jgi:hypothetical protein
MPEQDPSLRYMLSSLANVGREVSLAVRRLHLLDTLTTLDNLRELYSFEDQTIPTRKADFITSFRVQTRPDHVTSWHHSVRHLDDLSVPLRQSRLNYSLDESTEWATLVQNNLSADNLTYNVTIDPLEPAEPTENFKQVRRFSVGLTALAREAIRSCD